MSEIITSNWPLIVLVLVCAFILWPSKKEIQDYELRSRCRYNKTAELEEQNKQCVDQELIERIQDRLEFEENQIFIKP